MPCFRFHRGPIGEQACWPGSEEEDAGGRPPPLPQSGGGGPEGPTDLPARPCGRGRKDKWGRSFATTT